MTSIRKRTGYLMIDHKFSPGLTPEEAHRSGMGGLAVGGGKLFEADTLTCCHCSVSVIKNPQRTRERGYCARCDAYLCDVCAAALATSGVCCNIDKLLDYVQEKNAKMEEQGLPVTGLPDLSPLLTTVSVTAPKKIILG